MAKHFGERRDPSMGSWPAEARQENDELAKKTRLIHRHTKDNIEPNPEDALIAKIDGQRTEEDDQFNEIAHEISAAANPRDMTVEEDGLDETDPMIARGTKYFRGERDVNVDANVQQNANQSLPRDNTWSRSSAQKRYPSNELKSNDAQIRKQRKLKHK